MKTSRITPAVFLVLGLTVMEAKMPQVLSPPPPVTVYNSTLLKSKPLPSVTRATTLAAVSPLAAGAKSSWPRDMKLLLITASGDEPGYIALRFFLDYLGIPYDAVVATKQKLPALSSSSKGLYQGIILATGGLSVCDSAGCRSALSTDGWAALDAYARDFSVRTVSYYTWPEPRYGLTPVDAVSTETMPAYATFEPAAANVFPYLGRSQPMEIRYAYLYLADPVQAEGETTTPILTVNGKTTGVIHTKPDGREYMALTIDSSPYLLHAMALNYGIFNWVTKGVFIGSRKVYMTPQVDDHFLANDLYVDNIAACKPTGFIVDATYDPSGQCPTVRIAGDDLRSLSDWQKQWTSKTQFKSFKVTHAFNGYGTTTAGGAPRNDSLTSETTRLRNDFYWINHTWDHEHLDCYNAVPNSGVCRAATYQESLKEISLNLALALAMRLPLDSSSMVTPAISGLNNANFLKAAKALGIKYLVSDASRPEYVPAIPNTGLRSTINSSILFIPRRATSIFYNTDSGLNAAQGSLPDEYNYFYGPNGIFRVGGPGGPAFFSVDQSYADIVNRESDNLLAYMMRYEIYPQMYHQGNLWRYVGSKSLFTDVIDAAFTKFSAISNLPVLSLTQSEIGREIEGRMATVSARIQGTLTPGSRITLTAASGTANAPLTGVCSTGCQSYGGQSLSKVSVKAGKTTTVMIPATAGK